MEVVPPPSADEITKACKQPDPSTKGYGINHVMLRIKDPKKSIEFYTGVFGMRLLQSFTFPSIKQSVYVVGYEEPQNIPRTDAEKNAWVFGRKSASFELTYLWKNDPKQSYHNGNKEPEGYGHTAIAVPDINKACAKFEELGLEFVHKIGDGGMKNHVKVVDPDGYWIEVIGPNIKEDLDLLL